MIRPVPAKDAEAAASKFVGEHPEVRNYILATAIGLVVGTIVEDVLSGGAGTLAIVAPPSASRSLSAAGAPAGHAPPTATSS